jgi:hypothetical protein
MKRRFIYLATITAVALIILLVFVPETDSPDGNTAPALLLPGMGERINEVNRVRIIAAGNDTVATMLKTGEGWQVQELAGYRADWPTLQSLLEALATAKIVEKKTDNPAYYARLGVEDVESPDARSVLVVLGIDGEETGVLVGNSVEGRTGQYVRLQGATGSVQVDREIDVTTGVLAWADSEIIDINSAEVAEVEIIHPDNERILITRLSADQTDFDLVGLPEGREIKSSWAVNSLGSVLSMLNMQSVRKDEDIDWSPATRMRLLTFSGIEVIADVLQLEDEKMLRLSASHPESLVTRDEASDEDQTDEQRELEARAEADVGKILADITTKTAGWAYVISQQKYDAMVKKPGDLLKPVEDT